MQRCTATKPRQPAHAPIPPVARLPHFPDQPLKLHLDRQGALNFITAYDPGYVQVNQTRHHASLIVLGDRIVEPWRPRAFEDLGETDFEVLAGLGADIVLLGTGRTLRFPPPRMSRSLMARHVGLEVMDSSAACRTFNILVGEGRNVAAALILE